jgi:hypothetical protein
MYWNNKNNKSQFEDEVDKTGYLQTLFKPERDIINHWQ